MGPHIVAIFHEDNDDWPVDLNPTSTHIDRMCCGVKEKLDKICSGLRRNHYIGIQLDMDMNQTPEKNNPWFFPMKIRICGFLLRFPNQEISCHGEGPPMAWLWNPTTWMWMPVACGGCPDRGWCDERRDSNRNWYPHVGIILVNRWLILVNIWLILVNIWLIYHISG